MMKNLLKAFATAMVAAAVLLSSCSAKTDKKLIEYKNEGLGVQFQRPEAWQEMMSADTGAVFMYPSEDVSFSVSRYTVNDGIGLDIAGKNSVDTLKGQYEGFKLIEQKTDYKVGGLRAFKIVYVNEKEINPKTYIRVLVIKDKDGYSIDFSCKKSLFDTAVKDFNAVVDTLKFISAPATP